MENTFELGRAELVRLLCKRLGEFPLSGRRIKRLGHIVSSQDLYALREGDEAHKWSIRRLVSLANSLGIRVHLVAVVEEVPEGVKALLRDPDA